MKSLPKTFKLNNGLEIPSIGQGSNDIRNDIADVIYNSIKDGVRLFDTAAVYGSEKKLGEGVKKAIDEGIVKRSDLFIVTKIAHTDRENPENALKESLKNLGMDYVDLYLDHWPAFYLIDKDGKKIKNVPLHVIWPKMEALVEKGLTKSIGVSNYNVQSIINLLSFCKIKPVINEVEYHPYLNQKNLKDFCDKEGIKILAYLPFVKGDYIKDVNKEFPEKLKLNLLEESIVKELAKKYNKTVGQIILNWEVDIGIIPIPMTSNPHRMKENIGALDFKMDKEDVEKINGLNKNCRFNLSGFWNVVGDYDVFA